MTITLSPELEAQLLARAEANGVSVDTYLRHLVEEDEWFEASGSPIAENNPDFISIRDAVSEGLENVRRGESYPAKKVFAELRAKHGIPR